MNGFDQQTAKRKQQRPQNDEWSRNIAAAWAATIIATHHQTLSGYIPMTPPTDSAMLDLTWSCCNYTGWDLNGQCMITLSTASNATECLVSVPWARSIPSKFVDCRYIECIIHWDPIPFIIVNKLNRTQFISDKAYLDKDITDYDDWRSPRFACVERMLRAKTFHSTLVFFCLDDAFVPNQQSSINTSSNHPQSTSINVNQHRSANKRNHGTLFIKKWPSNICYTKSCLTRCLRV